MKQTVCVGMFYWYVKIACLKGAGLVQNTWDIEQQNQSQILTFVFVIFAACAVKEASG
jgi:hypothetical protein